MAAEESDAVAAARAENERLREENIRLRATISANRPETPAELDPANDLALALSPPPAAEGEEASDINGAASQLVTLMREGGELMREREMLRLEHEKLMADLEATAEFEDGLDTEGLDAAAADGSEPGAGDLGAALGSADAAADAAALLGGLCGEGGSMEPEDQAALERLLPLLSEGDALCAERASLRAEHRQLTNVLKAEGAAAHAELQDLDVEQRETEELARKLRSAVEEVRQENTSMEDEVKTLKEENARLRQNRAQALAEKQAAEVAAMQAANEATLAAQRAAQVAAQQKAAAPLPAPAPVPARSLEALPEGPVRPPLPPPPALSGAAELESEEAQDERRRAMETLLKSHLLREKREGSFSPTGSWKAKPRKPPPDEPMVDGTQQMVVKGALETLFKSFAKPPGSSLARSR